MSKLLFALVLLLTLGISTRVGAETVEAAKAEFLKLPEKQQRTIADVVLLHNELRVRGQLPTFTWNPRLNAAAQKFADYMHANGKYGHTCDGRTPGDRVSAEGYEWMRFGENIASGAMSPKEVVELWRNSPKHYENMVGPCTEIGFGKAGKIWVVVFGTPAGK